MIFDPVFTWFGWGFLVLALLTVCIIPAVRGDGPRWKWFARMGIVAVLALALARPGIPIKSSTEEYEAAADVYFLVDTTTSMAAEDYDGDKTRLEGVKKDMLELAEQLPGTRMSIISFASTASTVMPLTTDHSAFASAVDVLSPEMSLNSNGSSITEAGAELDERMKSNQEDRPDNKSLVFYFGDGEQTSESPVDSWSSFASRIDSGAVFGYGTSQGGKMKESQPFGYGAGPGGGPGLGDPGDTGGTGDGDGSAGTDGEYILDGQGNPGISTIDESNLRQISDDLGVKYHHRDGGASMSSMYTAPKYDQTLVQKDGRVTVDEYFWVPLLLVFAWIAVEMVFGVRELLRLRTIAPKPGGGRS
ncbi:VWA domain-containing protein [Brevibacterium sp. RIT 803]|uniref:vWA domain-containing protein n=1 Tax=Brevibacterium sp. RIT 803 TaxID=2810210 RepID=UPI00194FE6AA|nr:VWA domain-containing protein [Brevibacterium sp. RIT 803]MBM6588831.1 VWA domain-containing protein [Brevibacterium sp. RIT 803]